MQVPGLEVDRVAEILVTVGRNERGRRGSGYRVTTQTVLTAAHVVRDWSMLRVRFDADQPGEWSGGVTDVLEVPEVDIALLTIRPPGYSQVVPAQFGCLPERDDEIPCSMVGFPLWKMRAQFGRTVPGFRPCGGQRGAPCQPTGGVPGDQGRAA